MCVAASTMEGKKLLILASIRQPMADHSNKVLHINTLSLCKKKKSLFPLESFVDFIGPEEFLMFCTLFNSPRLKSA